jgi:hypothetical protein
MMPHFIGSGGTAAATGQNKLELLLPGERARSLPETTQLSMTNGAVNMREKKRK